MVAIDEHLDDIRAEDIRVSCSWPDPEMVRRAITLLQESLPESARITLTGTIERDGTMDAFSEAPLFHVQVTLFGSQKP